MNEESWPERYMDWVQECILIPFNICAGRSLVVRLIGFMSVVPWTVLVVFTLGLPMLFICLPATLWIEFQERAGR